MASRYGIEVKVVSAINLKNVNWRNGPNHSYAVVWVEQSKKCSTRVDKIHDINPNWEETFLIPLSPSATIEDSKLYINVLHAQLELEQSKTIIIGSTKLQLKDVLNDVGIGHHSSRTLKLNRPSGRPQGTVHMKVAIRDNMYPPQPYAEDVAAHHGVPFLPLVFNPSPLSGYVSPYGNSAAPPSSNVSSVYTAPPIYSGPPPTSNISRVYTPPPTSNISSVYTAPPIYSGPPPTSNISSVYSAPSLGPIVSGVYTTPPLNSYVYSSYGSYGAAPTPYSVMPLGQTSGQQQQKSYGYGQRLEAQAAEKENKSKMGVGTGLAVGALAGGVGALALDKGVDMFDDKIADRVPDKLHDDTGFESLDD